MTGVQTCALPISDIAKELSGAVKINLTDGTLTELAPVLKTLLTLLNPTTALQATKAGMSYESLGGDFKIVKGLVKTDNFDMESPQINLQVVGEANIGTDTINAQVKAMPLQMFDKTIKAILPQHGSIIDEDNIENAINYLIDLQCGLDLAYPTF